MPRISAIWSWEVGSEMETASTSHSRLALMSAMSALLVDMTDALRPMWAMCFTAVFSSGPTIGFPTSSWGTPALSRCCAILYFSMFENTTPAACSPAPRVESQMQRGAFRRSTTSLLVFICIPSEWSMPALARPSLTRHINARYISSARRRRRYLRMAPMPPRDVRARPPSCCPYTTMTLPFWDSTARTTSSMSCSRTLESSTSSVSTAPAMAASITSWVP